MNKVLGTDLDYSEELGIYTLNGMPFTGISYRLAPAGWVRSEEEFRDGLPCGVGRTWHTPTQLASESSSVGGVWHGRRMEWHKNGQIALEEQLELGITLNRKRWNEEGAIVEDFALTESDPNFEALQMFRKHNEVYQWTEK